jgi:hypothetical protein
MRIKLNIIVYLLILCLRGMFKNKNKKATMVGDLCAPKTQAPYFAFISMEKRGLNHARSSGKYR